MLYSDCVFFYFCRILNKLAPEKFDKLSLELLNVGIESQVILKGIILLVSLCSSIMLQNIFPRLETKLQDLLCLFENKIAIIY